MRNYFNTEAYLSQLNAATDISSCDAVPLPDISDNQNYIFVSYAHRDYKQVYADLALMYRAGVRFWYDRGLVAGKDWDAEAKRIIENPHCVGVIFFLSENLFLSESVNKEIDIVRGSDEQSRKNYFCVNLSDLSPSRILRSIMRMDDAVLDLAGLDMDRISVLANAFSDKMTYLRFSDPSHGKALIEQISSQFNVLDTVSYNRGYLLNKHTGERIPITEDTFVVGRTRRKCHYCIENDNDVSVVHFSVLSGPSGNLLMDFGATNGTFLNGKRLTRMGPTLLKDADEIGFGHQIFVFYHG